jgi:hypothetical protein
VDTLSFRTLQLLQSLVLLFAVFDSPLHIWGQAMQRHRLSVDPVGLPFAAPALVALAQRQRRLLGEVA